MRVVRYLLQHKVAMLLLVCLLIAQAFCDLSLPRYTSQIVDTGIQQKGVEHAATDVMSVRTHDLIAMMLTPDDEQLFRDSYGLNSEGVYEINESGVEAREQLDEAVALPFVIINRADESGGLDLDQALASYEEGEFSKGDALTYVGKARDVLAANEMLVAQQALSAARAEYEALGVDTNAMQMSYLKRIGLLMLLMAAGMMVAHILVGLVAARTSASIGRDLRKSLFERVVSLSEREVDSFSSASLITRGTNDVQQIQGISFMLQRMVLYAPILAIGGIVMVCRTNLSMAWIIIVAILAVSILSISLMAVTMPKFKMMQILIDRVNLIARELLTGLPVIRAFGREEHEEQRFDVANRELMGTQLFTNRVMAFMMPGMMLIMNLTSCAIVWIGGHYIDTGAIQTGDLIAFITYSMIIILSFLMLGMIAIILPRANVAAGRVNEVLACEPSIVDGAHALEQDLMLAEQQGGATIAFEDVCFAYDDSSDNVLDHVSFVAEAGKTTAIIGPTGCGKTTILKLIERFYDVGSGRVTVDGIDVRDLSQGRLRATFGYSPQQAFLFSGTVRSNVSYSDALMGEQRIRTAVEVSQAAEFVDRLDDGLDSAISQGGSNVSGGQRQRLSIARALAADARAYLFDDSFSALDYKTDARLRAELGERLAGKTVLIVAQRIATIMSADRIIVLDEGRIVGQGTHRELLESCETYRLIAESQLSRAELARGGAA